MKKVYCSECEYISDWSAEDMSHHYRCYAPIKQVVSIIKENFFARRDEKMIIIPQDPKILNIDNDCKYFRWRSLGI